MVARLLPALLALALGTGARAQSCGQVVPLLTAGRSQPECSSRFLDPEVLRSDPQRAQRAVEAGLEEGARCWSREYERERRLQQRYPVMLNTPEYHHYLIKEPFPGSVEAYNSSLADACAAAAVVRALAAEFNLSLQAAGEALPLLNVSAPSAAAQLSAAPAPAPDCDASARYRTYDGSCNNLLRPLEGSPNMPFSRLLPPYYDDGVYEPRRAQDGSELPNARLVREKLIPPTLVNSEHASLVVMQWAQFIVHDAALSFDTVGINGLGVQCCAINRSAHTHRVPLPPEELPLGCLPVVGPGDYCVSVARSNSTFADARGFLAAAEQIALTNQRLDSSLVYGYTAELARQLRAGRGGRLAEGAPGFPPTSPTPQESCNPRRGNVCYLGGDPRINQNTQLTVLQTLLLREHNRVVAELAGLNPGWDDERLYQEGRRIVNAEMLHITYSRLVPILVGIDNAEANGLIPAPEGFDPEGYDETVEGTVTNSFTGAAYRVFHGMAQPDLKMVSRAGGCPMGNVHLDDWFDTPLVVSRPPLQLERLLLGLITQPSQETDQFYTQALANRMFETNLDPGQDLATFDIQRARDRGLPPYTHFRELCGFGRASTWDDIAADFEPDRLQGLKDIYTEVGDIDLFPGVFLERLQGGAVGPTGRCIIIEQFFRWMRGDRFFYTFEGEAGSFTLEQLNQLKLATLSRLVCDNAANVTEVQVNAFLQANTTNPVVKCSEIPYVDLSPWRDA